MLHHCALSVKCVPSTVRPAQVKVHNYLSQVVSSIHMFKLFIWGLNPLPRDMNALEHCI